MNRAQRPSSSIGTQVATLLLVAVSVGLSGCYTQFRTAETAPQMEQKAAHTSDVATDESTYADEYRRANRRSSYNDGVGVRYDNGGFQEYEYRYEYKYKYKYGAPHRSAYGIGWYDDSFHDPFYNHYGFYDPYGPRTRFSVSVRFGSPHYAHRPWRPYYSSGRPGYGYGGWGYGSSYANVYYGNVYYGGGYYSGGADGEGDRDDRRTYRSRTSTRSGVGRQPAAAPPRTISRESTERARTRTPRTRSDDEARARSERVGRAERARSGTDRAARARSAATNRSDRQEDERAARRARSRSSSDRPRAGTRDTRTRRDNSRSRADRSKEKATRPRTRSRDRSRTRSEDRSRRSRSRDDDE